MIKQNNNAPFSQRQLRVGELIKQSLGQIFLRDEAKVPILETKNAQHSLLLIIYILEKDFDLI